jgi:hypothetical protein
MCKLYQKYEEAIDDFYKERFRPEGKKLLIPTLKNCGSIMWGGVCSTYHYQQGQQQKMSLEDTRLFMPHMLEGSKYWQKTASL